MENTTDLGSWPTEVLFSFFRALDPLEIHNFSGVSKKWQQMSQDNELWRQFCNERWQNNPKESDCAKNWLIPMREGVGNKESRIDWRKVYLIRDLANTTMRSLDIMQRKPRRKAVKQPPLKDFFEKGWIELKDIQAFEDFVTKCFNKIDSPEKHVDEIMHVINFHLEFELLMVKQVNISRMNNLGFAQKFLEEHADKFFDACYMIFPRFVEVLNRYFELAVQKDVPLVMAANLIIAMTTVITCIFESTDYPEDPDSLNVVKSFFEILIRFIDKYPYGDAYNQWISEDFTEDETSPTHEFEESLNTLSAIMKETGRADDLSPIILSLLTEKVASTELRTYNTLLAILGSATEAIKDAVLNNLQVFVPMFILPSFKVDQSTPIERLVPMNYYFATIFSNLGTEIQIKYLDQLMPGIITMAGVNHPRVQYHIGQLLLGFCEHLGDGNEALGKYMPELLSKLYTIVLTTKNDAAREKVIFAISSIVITCRDTFAEVREGLMTTFKALLAKGGKKDREAIIEALSRIGAGVGEQKESIAGDVESLYAQVVEDFKNDRPAHEELLIKLTEFGVSTMGKQFTKYLPIVFPVIFQHATAEVLNIPEGYGEHANNDEGDENDDNEDNDNEDNDNEDNGDNEDNDNENENEDDGGEWNQQNITVNEKEVSLKSSCVAALGNIVEQLDRDSLIPYYDQILEALRGNVAGQGIPEMTQLASEVYLYFTGKFFPLGMEAEWVEKMRPYFRDVSATFCAAIETEELDVMERVLTAFNAIFEILIKHSPANQPFVDDEVTVAMLEMCILCMDQFYTNEEEFDIEDIHDYGFEAVNLFELLAKNTINKQQFIPKALNFLGFIMTHCMQHGPSVMRWLDLCVMTTTFEFYGEYFPQYNLSAILSFLWSCREIDSRYTQQAIAYYLSVYARKYPNMLPTDTQPILDWLDKLLTAEYKSERPFVYDNALLAYGYVIERTTQSDLLMQRMKKYLPYFPPTSNGDIDEGSRCLDSLARLSVEIPVETLKADSSLMTILIQKMKESLAMEVFNNESNHAILDPIINFIEDIAKQK